MFILMFQLSDDLPFEKLLRQATELYKQFPPESVEPEVKERCKQEYVYFLYVFSEFTQKMYIFVDNHVLEHTWNEKFIWLYFCRTLELLFNQFLWAEFIALSFVINKLKL